MTPGSDPSPFLGEIIAFVAGSAGEIEWRQPCNVFPVLTEHRHVLQRRVLSG